MSTLWTPGGERTVPPRDPTGGGSTPSASGGTAARPGTQPGAGSGTGPAQEGPKAGPGRGDQEEQAIRQLEEARRQLLSAPAEDIVANHCYGLFELAALYLSARPPALVKARLAIDALAALVERLEGRLGTHEPDMRDALTQIRLAFVQIQQAPATKSGETTTEGSPAPGENDAPGESAADS
jgi:hypothetical protein